jgi:ribonucleoside-diphosphate reductase alpha chain
MVKIDYSRDQLFDDLGLIRLRESYMRDEEKSPQERFAYVSEKFSSNPEHAQRIYDYASKHWLSFATPILAFGKSEGSLPISCFLSYIPDTRAGLVDTLSEVNWLSMQGGGVGIGVGIRSSDDKSTGVMSHLKTYDACSLAYRQGKTRRGTYAAYLNISHPDIIQFIQMRKATGDNNIRCLNLHHGVNITDNFMQIIEQCMYDKKANDDWLLIDPHTNEIKEIVSAKELWQSILETRMITGEPYIHFIDTSNKYLNPYQKAKGLTIKQSNICTEITLVTDENRTAVCCLSSVNIEYFDDWKDDNQFLYDIAEFLDNVLQYFIDHAGPEVSRAVYSAKMERSIGVGALGLHAYFQKLNVPFESISAKSINKMIFKHIESNLGIANFMLGARGEAPDIVGSKNRFSHTMAIAPNATSSIIVGNTSPSVEPFRANIFTQKTLSGFHTTKNKYLDKFIKETFPQKYDDIWSKILSNKGSIQNIEDFSGYPEVKDVFKTAMEIDQKWIITLAADRQKFIDQSQSINLFFHPTVNRKYLHMIHFMAWKQEMKTLYYCRSEKIGESDKIGQQIERQKIEDIDLKEINFEECVVCSG